MRRFVGLFGMVVALCMVAMNCQAQFYPFEKGICKLPYQERFYSQDKEGKNALLVYLHPKKARGHNNETQDKVPAFIAIDHYLDSVGMKAILLAPQCEECRHWNEYSAPIGKYYSDVVKDFICDYARNHNVDMSRIYVMGESFGGSGVWRLVSDYPTLFAAAMPAVCSPKLSKLEKYVKLNKAANTPLCIVIGEKDKVYGPEVMAPHIEKLKEKGCDMKYIIMPSLSHGQACDRAFTTEALDWLLMHKKK